MSEGGSRIAAAVAAVRAPARWLARLATGLAAVGAVAAVVLWWAAAGHETFRWWEGSVRSLVVLALFLAPSLWLVNVRLALLGLLEMPAKLAGITRQRGSQVRHVRIERPRGGVLGAVRSVRGIVGDYGEVVGSWGLVMQLLAPWFWLTTLAALVVTPLLAVAAIVVTGSSLA